MCTFSVRCVCASLLSLAIVSGLISCGEEPEGADSFGASLPTTASASASSSSSGNDSTSSDSDDSSASAGDDSSSSGGDDSTTGSTSGTSGNSSGTTATSTGTSGSSTSGDVIPEPIACSYQSLSYGSGMIELKVNKGSNQTLNFSVPGLPAPELLSEATLRFRGYDIDHPGEEGDVLINGGPPIALPANAGWDNQEHKIEIEIFGQTVAGANNVVFTAGTFEGGTFYRIGDLTIDVMAKVDDCPPPPESMGEEVIQNYHQATYTKRHNWVDDCNFNGGYAFTAGSDEHIDKDCEGLYKPDKSRTGKAIFTFNDLEAATYQIGIRSRHTVNRNPKGALIVVDGEGKRIKQNDDKDFVEDIWGAKALSGTIEVVVDSSMENASDSVIAVRLTPI